MQENKHITSTTHPLVKMIVQLHDKKGRKEHTAFIVEGYRACKGFQENNYVLLHLIATTTEAHTAQLQFPHATIITVANQVMEKISTATTPPGILAVFALPTNNSDNTHLQSGLVLAQINDPGNMGTLIRSCAAFGYRSLIIVEGCDPFSPKVIQACAGALPLIDLFQCDWDTLVASAHKNNLKLAALVVKNGKSVTEITEKNILFVVGNEAHGLPTQWINQCDISVTIPMRGATESLNAAVAGSIALALHSRV